MAVYQSGKRVLYQIDYCLCQAASVVCSLPGCFSYVYLIKLVVLFSTLLRLCARLLQLCILDQISCAVLYSASSMCQAASVLCSTLLWLLDLLPLLHELGSEPLVHCYVRRAVRFYNCLVELDAASVYRSALQQNIDDALSTRSRAHNFVGALFQVLRILLPREGGLTRTLRACLPLDIDGIDEALHTRYTEHIQRLSQVVNGPGSRTGLYFRVVGTHVLGVVPSFYSCRLSHGVLVRFLRFRLGCHHLRIHTGRWLPPLLPHSQRTCLRCSSTVVDDEAHCLFMCEHPTIVEARDLFLAAVVPPVAALSSLRYADFWALSATGCVPLSALVKYVAVCVRVCWYCHQSGGTDVVDLPDILLPAGQYLDLFDSESETDVPSDSSDEELVEV